MKKLLITGASGFLGGHLFSLAESRFQCLGTYFSSIAAVGIANWAQVDMRDFFQVYPLVADFQPDVIIHAAANANLDDCEQMPENALAINVEATANLVGIASELKSRFIYISSDMVFDGSGSLYSEDDAPNPLSVYGRTKRQGEEIVVRHENSVIVRSALIFGRRKIGGSSFSMWIENNLRQRKSTPLYTDQFRSPILVNNLAELLLELCDLDFTGVLHAGGDNRIDRYSFGRQLCDSAEYDTSLLQPISMNDHHPVAPRPQDVSLNVEKIKSVCSTTILTTKEGLAVMTAA